MNRADLARRYHVNLSTVDTWIVAGLPGRKVGGAWQFDEAEVLGKPGAGTANQLAERLLLSAKPDGTN
jgi:hypothetical protein